TLKTSGSQTVTATDTGNATITGTSNAVTVNPAAPARLAFGTQPGTTATGQAISPAVTVRILDAFDNLVTSDNTDQVTVGVASGPGSFTGTSTTTVTASGGIATFSNLVLLTPGAYRLSQAATGPLTGPNSNLFTVLPLQVGTFTPTAVGFVLQFNTGF